MTGKQLSDDRRAILSRLLQITKLSNREIAWVLGVHERTVQRRRDEFEATGQVKKHKDVSKNAEKLKPQHVEVRLATAASRSAARFPCGLLTRRLLHGDFQRLLEWHKDHPDALLGDMQRFLQTCCGLAVSVPTISRQLRKAYGGRVLASGRGARIRSRKQREAEGRSIALELQQGVANGDISRAQDAAVELYHDQRQLAPLQEILAPQHELRQQQEQEISAYHVAGGLQYQAGSVS
jgi:PHS family inorganic phosphate transporter-like MFS transporter